MRKDVVAAIIIGVALGGVVAFGIWRAKNYLSPKQISPISVQNSPQPSNGVKSEISDIVVTQPEDNSVLASDKVLVKGSANPKSTVVIISSNNEAVTEAKEDGSFEQEIELVGGPNEISIQAFDDQGNEATQNMTVVYSTEMGQ